MRNWSGSTGQPGRQVWTRSAAVTVDANAAKDSGSTVVTVVASRVVAGWVVVGWVVVGWVVVGWVVVGWGRSRRAPGCRHHRRRRVVAGSTEDAAGLRSTPPVPASRPPHPRSRPWRWPS